MKPGISFFCTLFVLTIYCFFPLAAQYFPAECFLDFPRCGFLRDNSYSLTIKGGINPHWYLNKTDSYFFPQPCTGGGQFPFTRSLWQFNKQYKLPWTIGIEAAYLACRGIEFFAEADYTSASRNQVRQRVHHLGHFKAKFTTFLSGSGYLGVRLYSAPFWCNKFAGFFGIKAGALYRHHANGRYRFFVSNDCTTNKRLSFIQGWTPSCGAQLGLCYSVICGWMYVLQVDGIVSGGWLTKGFGLSDPSPYVVLGQTGIVLSLPVTFSIRYNF